LKYKDIYESIAGYGTDVENYALASGKYGDAVYETSSEGGATSSTSWYGGMSRFPYGSSCFLTRGRLFRSWSK